jgi:hypothetical protein
MRSTTSFSTTIVSWECRLIAVSGLERIHPKSSPPSRKNELWGATNVLTIWAVIR